MILNGSPKNLATSGTGGRGVSGRPINSLLGWLFPELKGRSGNKQICKRKQCPQFPMGG